MPTTREALRGVFNILATPFTDDYAVDLPSLRRLAGSVVAAGVDGITVLGVAGEAHKLTTAERDAVVATVRETASVPTYVGVSFDGTDAAIAAARTASDLGAAGLMIAPPSGLAAGPALTTHYRRIADAVDLPIVLQDYPPATGVTMSPAYMAELVAAVPAIVTIKLEGIPTPQRTHQVLSLVGPNTTVVGGLGGVYLLDELRRGASGTMTGFAYPEILVDIWRRWSSGDRDGATAIYHRYLPLLVFEGQPIIGLALRKEILRRRGLIDSATVRQPATLADPAILEDLTATLTLTAPPTSPASPAAATSPPSPASPASPTPASPTPASPPSPTSPAAATSPTAPPHAS